VSVLLDTHVWLWWLLGQPDLPRREREALDEAAKRDPPLISAISLWEAQMLHSRRRLKLSMPFGRWLREAAAPDVVKIAPFDVEVVLAVNALPERFHGDPADRLIVATARALDVALATHDHNIRRSRLVRLWNI
jgi:PIN domain nuclease of toxin-antitoxin system